MGKPGTVWKKSGEMNKTFKKDVRAHQKHSQASGTANMESETKNTANLCDKSFRCFCCLPRSEEALSCGLHGDTAVD